MRERKFQKVSVDADHSWHFDSISHKRTRISKMTRHNNGAQQSAGFFRPLVNFYTKRVKFDAAYNYFVYQDRQQVRSLFNSIETPFFEADNHGRVSGYH